MITEPRTSREALDILAELEAEFTGLCADTEDKMHQSVNDGDYSKASRLRAEAFGYARAALRVQRAKDAALRVTPPASAPQEALTKLRAILDIEGEYARPAPPDDHCEYWESAGMYRMKLRVLECLGWPPFAALRQPPPTSGPETEAAIRQGRVPPGWPTDHMAGTQPPQPTVDIRPTVELLRLGERAARYFADGTRTDEPLGVATALKCLDAALGALEAGREAPPAPSSPSPVIAPKVDGETPAGEKEQP